MLCVLPYVLLWLRRVWHHDWPGSFRLGLRACPWALCSRSHYANAWYCNGPRNRQRWLWRLEATTESAPGCKCPGTDRDNIIIHHHIGQSAIAFQRMLVIISHNRLLFPIGQPEIPRNPRIVLVDFAVPRGPIVVFAARYPNPLNHFRRLDACFVRPATDVINHLVTHIRLGPRTLQSSPRLFFSCTCEAMISAITSSLLASLAFN